MQKVEWCHGPIKKNVSTCTCVCGCVCVYVGVRKQPMPGELRQRTNESKNLEGEKNKKKKPKIESHDDQRNGQTKERLQNVYSFRYASTHARAQKKQPSDKKISVQVVELHFFISRYDDLFVSLG